MKLYRCKTPTDRLCPCGKVARALKDAGIQFEQECVPLSASPAKRESILELTGQRHVPVLVTDDGTAIHDSGRILEAIPGLTSEP